MENRLRWSCLLFLLVMVGVFWADYVGAQQRPIKVGFISGFSGPYASINKKNLQGISIAVEEINKSGGILGRQIELLERDDKADPTLAVTIAKKLIEMDKIDVVVGPTLTATCVATLPIFTEAKMVQLISGTGVPIDVNRYPYVFRVAFGTEEQAETIVNYSLDSIKKSKIGLIGDSTPLGRNGAEDVKKVLKKRGMEPVGSEFFNMGDMDMTAQLKKLKDRGAEVLVLYAIGPDAANVLKGRKALGWDVPVIGHIALVAKGVLDLIGPELSKGVYAVLDRNFSFPEGGEPLDKMKKFRQKVEARYGKIDDTLFFFAVFYDPIYVYKYSVEKARTTDPEKVKEVMENITGLEGLQGTIKFRPNYHNGIWPEDMTVVKIDSFDNGFHVKAPNAP